MSLLRHMLAKLSACISVTYFRHSLRSNTKLQCKYAGLYRQALSEYAVFYCSTQSIRKALYVCTLRSESGSKLKDKRHALQICRKQISDHLKFLKKEPLETSMNLSNLYFQY